MIMANNLKRQYDLHAPEYEAKALEVLRSGWYILGNEVKAFEKEWADYIGSKYCVGLASGLDALWISFRVLGIHEGDEVIFYAPIIHFILYQHFRFVAEYMIFLKQFLKAIS